MGREDRGPHRLDLRNREFWRQIGGYRRWIEFFFDQLLPEPHSTKQYEDTVGWALETDAESMIAERRGPRRPVRRGRRVAVRALQCPDS